MVECIEEEQEAHFAHQTRTAQNLLPLGPVLVAPCGTVRVQAKRHPHLRVVAAQNACAHVGGQGDCCRQCADARRPSRCQGEGRLRISVDVAVDVDEHGKSFLQVEPPGCDLASWLRQAMMRGPAGQIDKRTAIDICRRCRLGLTS